MWGGGWSAGTEGAGSPVLVTHYLGQVQGSVARSCCQSRALGTDPHAEGWSPPRC